MKQPPPFKTEADLCSAFIAEAAEQGWTAYPETAGYDLVLTKSGIQIGIQAKLRFNSTLLRQVIPAQYWSQQQETPHYLGILLPGWDRDLWEVCYAIGVAYFSFRRPFNITEKFWPRIENALHWDHCDGMPLQLPDYVPDVVAGASGPIQLTEWKVRALRLCAVLEIRGHLTSADFMRYRIDRRRWLMPFNGWLLISDGVYTRGPKLKFPEQHPRVYAEIREEVRLELAELDLQPVMVRKRKR